DIGADESDGTTWPITGTVIYVKPGGNDNNSGQTWAQAKASVNGALAVAKAGDELWIAQGVYRELVTLKSGVALYAGLVGTETLRTQRNFKTNPVILDGELADTVVLVPPGAALGTRLDGLTVQNGQAANGAGLYGVNTAVTVANAVFRNNYA